MKNHYITGSLNTPAGKVEKVATIWNFADVLSTIKVRWSVGRMNYRVKQGLYAVGDPDADSAVFVTANFKLSFDHLRRALHGLNAWILVLDTKGINVWCAAGKGTFGTKELVYRIKAHQLDRLVNHRTVIVPQLGAPGVAAHEVKAKTGFRVNYGPVRAGDIRDFVSSGYKTTPAMRKVAFNLTDRLKLIPVELTFGSYYLLLIPAVFFILAGLNRGGYAVDLAWQKGGQAVLCLLAAFVSGCVLTPVLLPWLPFRRFSLKGLLTSWAAATFLFLFAFQSNGIVEVISWFLLIGSISSFLAMNFTGSTTFTSLSGVRKEMKLALPMQIVAASLGLIGWIISRFL